MSVFSVPVTIGVDEERIAKEIERNVEDRVVENITNEVKTIMFAKNSFGRITDDPLRVIVSREVRNCITANEEEIIKEAAKILADKMSRSKAVKEATKEVIEEMKGE